MAVKIRVMVFCVVPPSYCLFLQEEDGGSMFPRIVLTREHFL
jgi:hypothetical protein